MSFKYFLYFFLFTMFSCQSDQNTGSSEIVSGQYTFEIKNLSSQDYPDNPDQGYMSEGYAYDFLKDGRLKDEGNGSYSFYFYPKANPDRPVVLDSIDLTEFIPAIPSAVKGNEYLCELALVNQEWNRNQVRFATGEFMAEGLGLSRVDLARNCLNAYLWEVVLYKVEDGQELPFTHGWFEFPHNLYGELFEKRNGVAYEQYRKLLENWQDPASEVVKKEIIAVAIDTLPISYQDKSDAMYPLKGARLKKYREIITPVKFGSMRDLQSDSTTFATFSPPGFYNRADPRATELGRIRELTNANLIRTVSNSTGDTLSEVQLSYLDSKANRKTVLTLGGLDLASLPTLPDSLANSGWKSSMGFGNHTFYESYVEHNRWDASEADYYAFLSDGQGQWLDSHKVGIDGPIMHWDAQDPRKLHIWLLSFERHALVGHYVLTIMEGMKAHENKIQGVATVE